MPKTIDGKSVVDINVTGDAKHVVTVWFNTKENDVRYIADKHTGANEWVFLDIDDGHFLYKDATDEEKQAAQATAAAVSLQQRRIARARIVNTVFGCFPCVKAWHNRRIATEASITFPAPEKMEFKIRGARDIFRSVETDKSRIVIDMIDYDSFGVLFRPGESAPP